MHGNTSSINSDSSRNKITNKLVVHKKAKKPFIKSKFSNKPKSSMRIKINRKSTKSKFKAKNKINRPKKIEAIKIQKYSSLNQQGELLSPTKSTSTVNKNSK
jgi:hypothetical protein